MTDYITPGIQFKARGKHAKIETVVDIYTTTDLSGDIISVTCLAIDDFLGQGIKREVPRSAVVRGQKKCSKCGNPLNRFDTPDCCL